MDTYSKHTTEATLGLLPETAQISWVVSWTSHFFLEHTFCSKEPISNKLWFSDLGIWQAFSQNWAKGACHLRGNNWECWLAMIKCWASETKIRILKKKCICFCKLDSFPIFKDFSAVISNYIDRCKLLVLCNKKCPLLEDGNSSANQRFPNVPSPVFLRSLSGSKVPWNDGEPMCVHLTEEEGPLLSVTYHSAEPLRNFHCLSSFGVVSKNHSSYLKNLGD